MKIAVIDGQGGGIGKAIVEKIRDTIGEEAEVIALGTNAMATAAMLKAGATMGASGENAIVYNVCRVDVIVGSLGILSANAMLGEISPAIAAAIGESAAVKILIPLNKCGINVAGVQPKPLPLLISDAVEMIKTLAEEGIK